jgi:N,N'-diacetylbacillosaminyl-diphospho-undecaprenol alpha-1,3-N-acetylgalactosaminyltransferase
MKNISIVVPLDFTAYLCNKHMVLNLLKLKNINAVYVIGEKTPDTNYEEIIESWGATFIPLKTYRHVSIIKDVRYTFRLKQLFKELRTDVVINVTTKPNVYGPIAARLLGIEAVFTGVWGRGTAFTDDKNLSRAVVRFFLKILLWNGFRLSKLTWVTNALDYKYLIEKNIAKKDRLFLTKNYVDCKLFSRSSLDIYKLDSLKKEFSIKPDEYVVILVGRMIWPKGVGEFAKASIILKDTNPKIRFILVGAEEHSSPDKVPTETLKKWSLNHNFDWVGYREDILSLYGISDLAVLPSYYKEGGYPRALTEPMALELPVISSDSLDCRTPVKQGYNGFWVKSKDAEDLALRIKELAENPSISLKFGQNSRVRVVEEYSEEVIMKEVIDKFESLF